MLYDISLGKPSNIHKWDISQDTYGTTYVSCKALKQRIRLGGGVDAICHPTTQYNNTDTEIPVFIDGYELCDYIKFSNSNKNMKLTALRLNERENNDKMEYHICYISFNLDDYELISYNLPNQSGVNICQTFRGWDDFQGCAIQYTSLYSALIRITLRDTHTSKYHNIMIGVDDRNDIKVVIKDLDGIELKEANDIYKSLHSGNKVKTKHFGITFTKRFIPTLGIFVNAGDGDDKLNKIKSSSICDNNSVIIALNGENALFNKDKEVDKIIKEEFVAKRLKAITLVDLILPPDFCKRYGFDHVFVYNSSTYKSRCIIGK